MLNTGKGSSLIRDNRFNNYEIGLMQGLTSNKSHGGRENRMRTNEFYMKLSQASEGASMTKASACNLFGSPRVYTPPMRGAFQWG